MTTDTFAATLAKPGKYLSFVLGHEEYGLEILKVQEIIDVLDVTRVPRTPSFVRGVVNLRGRRVPVVDLGGKFATPATADTAKTCIVVVKVSQGDRSVTVGVVVDEVSEVLSFRQEQIEPASGSIEDLDQLEFITGLGKFGKKVVTLLDIDRVLDGHELDAIDQMSV